MDSWLESQIAVVKQMSFNMCQKDSWLTSKALADIKDTRIQGHSKSGTSEVSLQVTAVKYILKKLDTVSHNDEPWPHIFSCMRMQQS